MPGKKTPPASRKKPPAPKPAGAPKDKRADGAADPAPAAFAATQGPFAADIASEQPLPFPIVAIGASAGGIEAVTQLFEALPRDTGMAYVVIQHLLPTRDSLLSQIFGRATRMPVAEAKEGVRVEKDHVYVIPPNRTLSLHDGALKLTARMEQRGQVRPIDEFMRSLADEHGVKSIGIVLSGTANDGTLGLEEIKAAGGITFAQDESAEQEGMPRSAIAAGVVDFVLPPHEIAQELVRISRHPYVAPEVSGAFAEQEPAFQRVLEILRQVTGADFSKYKRNTLQRRVTRRMVLHKISGLRDYARMLQAKPDEVEALYQDLLINVTGSFRNPESYDTLKTLVFPRLAHNRDPQEAIRVWSLGCSTGEKAYSIAMAYAEFAEASGRKIPLQVFATDENGAGIDKARNGVYPKTIARDVSPERLRRFFAEVEGNYRVIKTIRDMCVFAKHNALTDPPFSHIDLVACRNLLIYLDPSLQQRIIPLLHYALRPEGFLWLGGSETIGTYRDLFELLDPRGKIYLRRAAKRAAQFAVPIAVGRSAATAGAAQLRPVLAREATGGPDPVREADRVLLSRYSPPGVVVNEDLDILQFRGDTGPYLTPAPGRATLNLLKMLREGLLVGVRGLVSRARREKGAVREEGLRVRSNGGWREVDIVVIPVRVGNVLEGTYLVVFEEPAGRIAARARALAAEAQASAERALPSAGTERKDEIGRLKQELSATREYLQSVIEQQEAANEELQSANEEVQSANEELQSINEELETSKEEIQSANEELATVNDELQNRNLELSQINNDLTNLLASVNMAIVMLGPDLRIRRFTQPAEKMLNLIHADVGRPLSDIKLTIDVPDLEDLIVDVVQNVNMKEREVRDRNDHWYSLRIRPYRTLENKIDGAVVLLVDIDSLKQAERLLRESEQRFELLADSAPVLIWVNDLDSCQFANRAFQAFVGASESEITKAGIAAFVHPEDRERYLEQYAAAMREKHRLEMPLRFRSAEGAYRVLKMVAAPRFMPDGTLVGFVGSMFAT